MPLLISGGDSFTWGSELPDQFMNHEVNLPSQLTWSARIAQHQGWDYSCVAKPGSGNNSITRRVIAEVAKQSRIHDKLYVAVMWTYTHRSEIRLRNMHPYNTVVHDPVVAARFDIDNYWINLNAWHGLSFEEKMEYFPKDIHPERYQFFQDQHDKMTEIGITDASKYFYAPTGDNYYHQYNFLKEINLLQFYLQSKNIPYFFCLAADEILNPEPQVVAESGLWESIKWDAWYKDVAFHPWTQRNNYPLSGSHPDPSAHADWFNLILPKINACFKQNNA
jgi:hypothetical protein